MQKVSGCHEGQVLFNTVVGEHEEDHCLKDGNRQRWYVCPGKSYIEATYTRKQQVRKRLVCPTPYKWW